jgi:O-antigen/teichoic acid export membrane protein
MQLARSLARNVVILLTSQVVTSLFGLVVVLLLPILLGEVGLGHFAFAMSACTILGTLITLGTSFQIVRDIAADHRRLPDVIASNISLRGMLWVVVGVVGLPFLLLRGVPTDEVVLFVLLYAATLGIILNSVLAGALFGLEKMGRTSIAAVTDSIVVLVMGLPLLILTHSPVAFAVAVLGGTIVHLAINVGSIRSLRLRFPRPTLAGYRALAVGAAPFLALAASQGVYSQVDTVMTGLLADAATVGWFAAAARLTPAVMLVPLVMIGALFPAMSRLMPVDPGAAAAAFRRMLDVVVLLVLPMAVGLGAIAPQLFAFLGYPAAFQRSAPILVIMSATCAVSAVGLVLAYGVVVAGRMTGWVIANLVLLPILITLNVLLIPVSRTLWSNGGVGAAAANLIAESAITLFAVWWLPRGLVTRANLWYGLRVLLASGLMGALIVAGPRVPLPVVVIAASLSYVVVSLGVRTLSSADVRLLVRLLRRVPLDEGACPPVAQGDTSAAPPDKEVRGRSVEVETPVPTVAASGEVS